MHDLTKRAARLDRKLKRLAPEIAGAVKLAGDLARDLEAQFAALEAQVAQLRPMASALAGKAPAPRSSPPPADGPGEIVERYAAARLERSPSHVVQAAALYSDFAAWCIAAGVPAVSRTAFGRLMRDMEGIRKRKSRTVKYIGI
ncbi:MAG: hypothetical protein ACOC71_01020, partial [Hyphomicrobiales bacterium]